MGLPSGTLWATCNVGASSPEDYGDYFAWGETEPKSEYSWTTYKWCNGRETTLTKYCVNSSYGTVDNKTELDPEDDAAYVNWGESWWMPTDRQNHELLDNCTWTWTQRNGINGCLITGPNGNELFLPAAGINGVGFSNFNGGMYWSSTIESDMPSIAFNMYLVSGCYESISDFWSCMYRYCGSTIHPVHV